MTSPQPSVRVYLIYVVLDTSESMRRIRTDAPQLGSAYDHFTRLVPRMLRDLADSPVTSSLAWVSVLAFNDEPQVLRPMTSLSRAVAVERPALGYGTDYAAVLHFIVGQHAKDVRSVKLERASDHYQVDVSPPWIFFISDGLPFAHGEDQATEEWIAPRDRLTGPLIEARIIALGLPGADQDVLWQIASGTGDDRRDAFISDGSDDPSELAESVSRAILSSISASVRTGRVTMRTPAGMHRIEAPWQR